MRLSNAVIGYILSLQRVSSDSRLSQGLAVYIVVWWKESRRLVKLAGFGPGVAMCG